MHNPCIRFAYRSTRKPLTPDRFQIRESSKIHSEARAPLHACRHEKSHTRRSVLQRVCILERRIIPDVPLPIRLTRHQGPIRPPIFGVRAIPMQNRNILVHIHKIVRFNTRRRPRNTLDPDVHIESVIRLPRASTGNLNPFRCQEVRYRSSEGFQYTSFNEAEIPTF